MVFLGRLVNPSKLGETQGSLKCLFLYFVLNFVSWFSFCLLPFFYTPVVK